VEAPATSFRTELGYCDEGLKNPDQSPQRVPRLRAWLSLADAPRRADLIFVLAGRVHRKEYALELFRQGLAPRILFSVGRFEIRRFSKMDLPAPLDLLKLAQEVTPPRRHYFVFFQGQEVQVEHVPPRRFGTLTEIDALARWLAANPAIRSVLVISSDTHLRRIRMCCRFLLNPEMEKAFLAVPLSLPERPAPTMPESRQDHPLPDESSATTSAVDDLLELFKLAIYWVLLKIR
jgi:uncharacterized SAM-binding protein YcdF (DUF218 family)